MNLRELRTALENETRHHPDLVSHREDLNACINDAYQAFCGEMPGGWPWLRRRAPLLSFPDLVIPNASVGFAAGWGARTLQLPSLRTGVEPSMFGLADESLAASIFRQLPGADFELVDMTLRGEQSGIFARAPYTIECVVEIVDDTCAIQLDPRFTAAALGTDVGDYAIRFRRSLLPPDCKSLIAVYDEEGRPLRAVGPTQARRWIENDALDTAGTTGWFLEDMGSDLRLSPSPVDIFLSDPAHSPYTFQRETWPVRETISISENASVGSPTVDQIPVGTRIRVFACWFWAGRFGPPSNIAELETTGDINTISVTGFPVLPTTGSEIEWGRRIAIFMAEGEGAFFLRTFVRNPALSTVTIDTRNTAANSTPSLRFPRYDEIAHEGAPQYIRLHPRPSQVRRLEIEYVANPRKLIEGTDSPEIPGHHQVLVWLALAQILASPRYNGNASQALAMAQKFRSMITGTSSPQDRDKPLVRGQVDQPRGPVGSFFGPDIEYIP